MRQNLRLIVEDGRPAAGLNINANEQWGVGAGSQPRGEESKDEI